MQIRGMNVSETHRPKALEDKKAKLKRLFADTMLDNVVLKNLLERPCRLRTKGGANEHRGRHESVIEAQTPGDHVQDRLDMPDGTFQLY